MSTIRAFTTIEQSRKLTEILPLESADMHYHYDNDFHELESIPTITEEDDHFILFPKDVRCWSIAALLEQFPYELCDDDGNSFYLEMDKEDDVYQLKYTDPYEVQSIETDRYEHFIDACYKMIILLNELKML